MDSQAFLTFYLAVQKATLPAIWSRGVSLARENAVLPEAPGSKPGETHFKIRVSNRPVSPRVTLWIDEEDWFCDCGDRNDPCVHVAAAVVWLKTAPEASQSPDANAPSPNKGLGTLSYRFKSQGQTLTLERYVVWGAENELPLPPDQSLVSLIGGITSKRIPKPPIAASNADLAIDATKGALALMLSHLEDCADVTLDGAKIRVNAKPATAVIELTDQASGFRLCLKYPDGVRFLNAMIANEGLLRPLKEPNLTSAQKQRLSSPGLFFSQEQTLELLTQILPELEALARVEIKSTRLPVLEELAPRLEIEMQKDSQGNLEVFPHLYYGTPPIAEIRGETLVILPLGRRTNRIPKRDLAAEREILLELRHDLFLKLDQRVTYQGIEAVRMAEKLATFKAASTSGESQAFVPQGVLLPTMSFEGDRFELGFEVPGVGGGSGAKSLADPKRVFEAWKQGESIVQLMSGGWAKLPRDWLERFGARALHLLEKQRSSAGVLATHFRPELARLFEDCTPNALPASLARLRGLWQSHSSLPEVELPRDLAADMRSYQREGFRWLSFLKQCGLGALLADDMGLGKTLQVMATFTTRCLVVCPTSVLNSWRDQLTSFRPGLRVSIYHGSRRDAETLSASDVVLTSYGVLRQDLSALTSQTWDTVVLDEAQMIRNSESQMAQAAFKLKAQFRVALSGTPIENRAQDLWSIFNFTHPGLLGEKTEFRAGAMGRGETYGDSIRLKIRPFILRRLKEEVASELPPRTEAVLSCELTDPEREVYTSVLAATRKEILEKLEESSSTISVMNLLTALLRLRQACCHSALVGGARGGASAAESSSKIELLLETLREVTSLGHRCLVFSQWTSFLDLVEPHLSASGLDFLRLDGTTANRGEVIAQFQDPKGPPVFLLSLKAGGVGLNLTAADYVFILDPWWNPATEAQAADRAHRIGQTKPVMIYRLIAENTIEERVLELQAAKKQLAENLLEGSGEALKREELMELLLDLKS